MKNHGTIIEVRTQDRAGSVAVCVRLDSGVDLEIEFTLDGYRQNIEKILVGARLDFDFDDSEAEWLVGRLPGRGG